MLTVRSGRFVRLLRGDVFQPMPFLDAELGIDVICVGGMHHKPHNGRNQEAPYSREQNLRPVYPVILQVR